MKLMLITSSLLFLLLSPSQVFAQGSSGGVGGGIVVCHHAKNPAIPVVDTDQSTFVETVELLDFYQWSHPESQWQSSSETHNVHLTYKRFFGLQAQGNPNHAAPSVKMAQMHFVDIFLSYVDQQNDFEFAHRFQEASNQVLQAITAMVDREKANQKKGQRPSRFDPKVLTPDLTDEIERQMIVLPKNCHLEQAVNFHTGPNMQIDVNSRFTQYPAEHTAALWNHEQIYWMTRKYLGETNGYHARLIIALAASDQANDPENPDYQKYHNLFFEWLGKLGSKP